MSKAQLAGLDRGRSPDTPPVSGPGRPSWRLGPNAGLIGQPHSREQLQTPTLLVDLDALERNVGHMAGWCRANGIALRPHAKTHKSVDIARLQLAAGAVGICTATIGEAEAMVEGGITGLLVTSPAVGPTKIRRFMALAHLAPDLMIVADAPENVAALANAAAAEGVALNVVVALDVGLHRIGTATPADALGLAQQIVRSGPLVFAGVHAYAGGLQHVEDYEARLQGAARVHETIALLLSLLRDAGLPPPVVSGAGTGTHEIDARSGTFTEMQAGSYVFTDVEYDAVALRRDTARPFDPALFVRTTVVSANHTGFVTTDAGTKRFSMGGAMPRVAQGAALTASYGFMGDEHGRLGFKRPEDCLPVGAAIEVVPPHCDPTVNLYDVYHVVRGDRLVDIWPVSARGAI
ncbi:DSD1 family PLP-dependent enzyme [Aquabacter sp. CN5-332]|uniref:DSD1 family PLP-dependent enzyme n=1 Tax=Aquabacter sp. CN5-332 TaxID=3156608 RepID=UPI0032B3BAE5